MNRVQEVVRFAGILTQFFKMLIINNRTPIICNQNFKYSPEPIIYNRKLYTMKPQGSSKNKLGSKYSPAPVIYNRALFKRGATDLSPKMRCGHVLS
jgi:hypothetical protein